MARANQNNTINTISHKIVRNELEKTNRIKHIPATVVDVPEEKNNGVAKVSALGRTLTLLNKTGEVLKEGEGVIIHYWDNVANGYIALRCGLPVYKNDYSEGNDYTGELPVDEETTITNSYVLHEREKEGFSEYEYETDDDYIESMSFGYTDYNPITIVATTEDDIYDHKSVGSAGISELFWTHVSFPSHSNISYNFTPFTSYSGFTIVSDVIVPVSLSLVTIGEYVYIKRDINGDVTNFRLGSGDINEYGIVFTFSGGGGEYNSVHEVEYNRKTNSMIYNTKVAGAWYDGTRWYFVGAYTSYAYEAFDLIVVATSYQMTKNNPIFLTTQNESRKEI